MAMSNIPSCVSLRNFNSLTDDDMTSDDDRPLLISVTRKQLIYVWNERQRTTYKARVIRKDGKYAKVHYINFNKRYDEWVNLDLISTEKDELEKKWKSKERHVDFGSLTNGIVDRVLQMKNSENDDVTQC